MKVLLKTALLLLLPVLVHAQSNQKQLDSLHLALKHAPNDTIRLDTYGQLGYYYSEINLDSSIYYLEKAVFYSHRFKLKLDEANWLHGYSYALMHKGNYPEALETIMKALQIAKDPATEENIRHLTAGQNPHTERLKMLGAIHNALGHLYDIIGIVDKQMASYREVIHIAESIGDTLLMALVNMNIGNVYFNLRQFDSSFFFLQKSLAYYADLPFEKRKYEAIVLNAIGDIYLQRGNLDQSREILLRSVQVSEAQNNFSNAGRAYVLLAKLYQAEKKPDSSLLYAGKTLEIVNSVGNGSEKATAYNLLFTLYNEQNKTDSAFAYLKLSTSLNDSLYVVERKKLMEFQNMGFDEQLRRQEMEKEKIQTQSKISTYAMLAGITVFMIIAFLLYKNNRNRQKANALLQTQKDALQSTLTELKSTQSQLIHSEKMASLGELTAGIAHEIQNPLNFVNNFSEVNKELLAEMTEEIRRGNYDAAKLIAKDVTDNEEKIIHHGKRADAIVKGMLQHSRSSNGIKVPTDINALVDEYLHLSYHGLRAKDKSFNAIMKTDFDNSIGNINIIPQDIGRVLLNLYNNAFFAVSEKQKVGSNHFEPQVTLTTKKINGKVEIKVADNGIGIPEKVLDKIFQPFFTTKPTGQGTGLGLSLSYDIVKAHGGVLKVESKEGEGSAFIVSIPFV